MGSYFPNPRMNLYPCSGSSVSTLDTREFPSGTLEITWSSTANLIGEDTLVFAQLVRAVCFSKKEGYGQKR